MTLKVIPLLQAFSSAIRRTFVQYFTRFQLTARCAVPQRQLGFLFGKAISASQVTTDEVSACSTIATYLSELCKSVSTSVSRSHLRLAARGDLAERQDTLWSEKFRRFWSDPVELPVAECSRSVADFNSVLYASEDCYVQQSLRKITISPP